MRRERPASTSFQSKAHARGLRRPRGVRLFGGTAAARFGVAIRGAAWASCAREGRRASGAVPRRARPSGRTDARRSRGSVLFGQHDGEDARRDSRIGGVGRMHGHVAVVVDPMGRDRAESCQLRAVTIAITTGVPPMTTAADLRDICCAALELSKTGWACAFAAPGEGRASVHRMRAGDTERLMGVLNSGRAKAEREAGRPLQIALCYEVGYDGFWLARRGRGDDRRRRSLRRGDAALYSPEFGRPDAAQVASGGQWGRNLLAAAPRATSGPTCLSSAPLETDGSAAF